MCPAMVETMMYAKEMPWHKSGFYVGDKEINSEQAIVAAGLDWEVELKKVFADSVNGPVLCPDNYAVLRKTDNSVLGLVGNRYAIVQNKNAFDFFDSVVGEKLAMYHTAGSLYGGKKVWMLAKLPDNIKVKGKDHIEKYLLLSTTHDGSGTLKMFFTPVRVLCANTLILAHKGFNAEEGISIRHTANAMNKMDQAKQTLGFAVEHYKQFEVELNFLADQKFNDMQMKMALQKLFPAKDETDVPTRTENMRNTVWSLYQNAENLKDYRGSAYAAWNSINEFAMHHKTLKDKDNPDSQLNSIWFGSGAQLSAKSFDLIFKMAKDPNLNPNLRA